MVKTKKHQNTSPVFRLKPINRKNKAIIKYVGILQKDEKLGDEVVELDTVIHPDADVVGKHAIPIKRIGDFNMVGRIYRCNLVGSYLVTGTRYPLMYLTIGYDRPMVSGSLLQIFLSIDIDKEEKKSITNNAQYVNLEFNGKWVQHFDGDDEIKEHFDRLLTEMLETEAANEFYNDDITWEGKDDMTEDETVTWIDKYVENNKPLYTHFLQNKDMKFNSINKTRDYFLEMCQSEKFYKFLEITMKCREIYRRNKENIDDDLTYTIPKNVTKLDDIKKQMMEDNELILDD